MKASSGKFQVLLRHNHQHVTDQFLMAGAGIRTGAKNLSHLQKKDLAVLCSCHPYEQLFPWNTGICLSENLTWRDPVQNTLVSRHVNVLNMNTAVKHKSHHLHLVSHLPDRAALGIALRSGFQTGKHVLCFFWTCSLKEKSPGKKFIIHFSPFVVITTYLLVGLYYSMRTKSRAETEINYPSLTFSCETKRISCYFSFCNYKTFRTQSTYFYEILIPYRTI